MDAIPPNIKSLQVRVFGVLHKSDDGEASLKGFSVYLERILQLAEACEASLLTQAEKSAAFSGLGIWNGPCYYYSRRRLRAPSVNDNGRQLGFKALLAIKEMFQNALISHLVSAQMLSSWFTEVIELNKEIQCGYTVTLGVVKRLAKLRIKKMTADDASFSADMTSALSKGLPNLIKLHLTASHKSVSIDPSDLDANLVAETTIDLVNLILSLRDNLEKAMSSEAMDNMIVEFRNIYKTHLRKQLVDVQLTRRLSENLAKLASQLFEADKSSLAYFGKILCRHSRAELVAIDLISLKGILRDNKSVERARVWPILNYHLRNEHPLVVQHTLELVGYLAHYERLPERELVLLLRRIDLLARDSDLVQSAPIVMLIVGQIIRLVARVNQVVKSQDVKLVIPNANGVAWSYDLLLAQTPLILTQLEPRLVDEQYLETAEQVFRVLGEHLETGAKMVEHISESIISRLAKRDFNEYDLDLVEQMLKFVETKRETHLKQGHGAIERMVGAMCSYAHRNPLGQVDRNFAYIIGLIRAKQRDCPPAPQQVDAGWPLACSMFDLGDAAAIQSCCEVLEENLTQLMKQFHPRSFGYYHLICGSLSFVDKILHHSKVRSSATSDALNGQPITSLISLLETLFYMMHLARCDDNLDFIVAELSAFSDLPTYDLARLKLVCEPQRYLSEQNIATSDLGRFLARWLQYELESPSICTLRLEVMALSELVGLKIYPPRHIADYSFAIMRRLILSLAKLHSALNHELAIAESDSAAAPAAAAAAPAPAPTTTTTTTEPSLSLEDEKEIVKLALLRSEQNKSWNERLMSHLSAKQVALLEQFVDFNQGEPDPDLVLDPELELERDPQPEQEAEEEQDQEEELERDQEEEQEQEDEQEQDEEEQE